MIKPMTDEEYATKQHEIYIKKLAYDSMKNKRIHRVSIKTKYPDIIKQINYKKQKDIDNLLTNLDKHTEKFPDCRIIVFGSATNGLCSWFSDIDICIDIKTSDKVQFTHIKKNLAKLIRSTLKSECDILILQNLNNSDKLLKSIQQEGVVIWQN